MKEIFKKDGITYYDNGLCSQEAVDSTRYFRVEKPVFREYFGNSDAYAQDAIEGRTRHNPQGNSRFKGKDNGNQSAR